MRWWRTGRGRCLGEALGKYKKVHPNDHVNYGQSTNDVFPTAMRLVTLLALEGLYPVLDGLAGGFDAKAVEFDGVVKAGRTHMQDAVPITAGAGVCGVWGGDAEGGGVDWRGRRRGCGSWGWAGRRWGRGSIRIRSIG